MHPDQTPSWQDGKTEDISATYRDPGRRNPWLLPLLGERRTPGGAVLRRRGDLPGPGVTRRG